jgi:hypothetical protein
MNPGRAIIELNAMKYSSSLLLLAIWISWSGSLLGQTPTKGFHWDWHKVEKDNWVILSQSKELSASERAALTRALTSYVPRNVQSDQELQDFATRTQIKVVHLDGNNSMEIAVQGVDNQSCSPTGNCEFWVLRRRGNHYSVILHRGATQTFTIQPTATNGFHDLVLVQHGSATEQGLRLYRFDGSQYRSVACYDANWAVLQNGKVHDLEEPQITPCLAN